MAARAAHAEHRPPSAAYRWLSCHGSARVMHLYPNNSSDASIKGDIAHDLLSSGITWGVVPNHPDIDLVYSAMFALEHVLHTYNEYRQRDSGVRLYTEQSLDIPETGEFGTTDIIFVGKDFIHIEDFKNGYVPVDVKMNPQLLLYLLGAIAKYGERKRYKITVIQPNYVHVDGMIRSYDVTEDDLVWFRSEVAMAMIGDAITAGKHCKTTYCPHRGSCEVFLGWAQENLKLAYYPSDVAGMNDEQLSEALEQAEILQGWRDTLRGEALRRMLHQDRKIPGYKIVKGKKDRDFRDEQHRALVFGALRDKGIPEDALYDHTPISVAGVERIVKGLYKPLGRNAWRKGMDEICGPDMLASQNTSLTVEKAIDGRKPYTRGSEFGPLKQATPEDATSNTSNTLKDIL